MALSLRSRTAGATSRFALYLLVITIVVLTIAALVQRSTGCEGRQVRYDVALPGTDTPADCRASESGVEILLSPLR